MDLQDEVVQQARKAHLVLMGYLGLQEKREKRERRGNKDILVQLDPRSIF